MASDGYSIAEIRRTLGMSHQTVKKYANNYPGLTFHEGAKLGAAARIASLKLERQRYGFNL